MPRLKNIKHETFVQKLVRNKFNTKQTYDEVYGARDTDNSTTIHNLMNRDDVKNRLHEVMHLVFTPEAVRKKLSQLMHAKKPVIYNGEITEYYDDNSSQIETLKMFLKSANVIDRTQQPGQTQTNNFQFNVAVIDSNEALSIAKEIKTLSSQIKNNPVAKKINAKEN